MYLAPMICKAVNNAKPINDTLPKKFFLMSNNIKRTKRTVPICCKYCSSG